MTRSSTYARGALYSVKDSGGYLVVKILAIDPGIVHVRVYKNRYQDRPTASSLDTTQLALGSIHDPDGFGMGHLPLSEEAFHNWQPVFLMLTDLREEELEGYSLWKDSGGGVWE